LGFQTAAGTGSGALALWRESKHASNQPSSLHSRAADPSPVQFKPPRRGSISHPLTRPRLEWRSRRKCVAQRLCMHVIGVPIKKRTGRWSRQVVLWAQACAAGGAGRRFDLRLPCTSTFAVTSNQMLRPSQYQPPLPNLLDCAAARCREAVQGHQHWNARGGGEATASSPIVVSRKSGEPRSNTEAFFCV